MMSYDKYERGHQHLNCGHQKITYKKKKKKNYCFSQSNQWIALDHAARIHSLNSPPMTSSVEKKLNDSDDDDGDINDNDKKNDS